MAKAVKRPAESWTFILPSDKDLPPAEQSRFVLRPMTVSERAAAQDDLVRTMFGPNGERFVLRRTHQQAYELALSHIVSVENFPADAPKQWPDARDEQRKYLEMLDDRDLLEIGNEVWRKSAVGGEEKNSSSPGRTPSSGDASPKTEPSTPAVPAIETQS